jgi:hypothetical protein
MPNWCQNHLMVTGATPELRAWLKSEGFSFAKMSPPRPPRKNARNPLSAPYDDAWGTKWDLDENEQRQVASDLLEGAAAHFDTAWSPPLQAIEALSRKFPPGHFPTPLLRTGNVLRQLRHLPCRRVPRHLS